MPNQPATPVRSVRMTDELWDAVKAAAAERGISASDLMREAAEDKIRALGR